MPNRGRPLSLLLALLLAPLLGVTGGGGPATAAPEAGPVPTPLGRAVVVDAARERLVLAHPDGGVEAVDVATGRSLWRSREVERPLLLYGKGLVGQCTAAPGTLGLVLLVPPASGVQPAVPSVGARLALPLAAGASAWIDDPRDGHFEVGATLGGEGVRVTWACVRLATQRGQRPVPATRRAARWDPATGTHESVDAAPAQDPLPPALRKDLGARGLGRRPARVGAAWGLALPTADGVALHRWDLGGGSHSIQEVGRGHILRAEAVDRRHVLLASPVDEAPMLCVLSLESADVGPAFPSPGPIAACLVAGERLLAVLPPRLEERADAWERAELELVALDLGSGQVVWRRPLRDFTFRGASPPTRR